MSGQFVPYQLRVGKGIDRRLFFHTLLKCSDHINIKKATYCSMPGPFAEDFKAIYNVLKVRDFIAIDSDLTGSSIRLIFPIAPRIFSSEI